MIYIGAETDGGCGIYLDVHTVARSHHGQELTAVIGDGHYEGEVLIVLGHGVDVTFVDALWGDTVGLRNFLEQHGEEKIRDDLRRTLSSCAAGDESTVAGRRVRPHVYLPLFADPGVVAEKSGLSR